MNPFEEIQANQFVSKIQKAVELEDLGSNVEDLLTKGEQDFLNNTKDKLVPEDIKKSVGVFSKAIEDGIIDENDIEKAKYLRREGTKGNYKYIYKEGTQGTSNQELDTSKLQSKIDKVNQDHQNTPEYPHKLGSASHVMEMDAILSKFYPDKTPREVRKMTMELVAKEQNKQESKQEKPQKEEKKEFSSWEEKQQYIKENVKQNNKGEFELLPLNELPLSSQLQALTGSSYNAVDFHNLDDENKLNAKGTIVHKKTGNKFNIPSKENKEEPKYNKDNRKFSVEKIQNTIDNFLQENNINLNLKVDDLSTEYHENYQIEPYYYKDSKFDGMQILYEDGTFEVSEQQAGKNQDELHIYKETPSLKVALKDLMKGNNRKPIKVWD